MTARSASNSARMSPPRCAGSYEANPCERRGVDDREVELRFGRAEPVEQVERLVQHPVRARLVPVDLVDHDDRPQAVRKRLLRDEARLRHRPVDRVDQQQHRVDHRQHPLDLAAEIGVTGRVDDVDSVVAPADRGVLREDRDAALALERVRVHDPVRTTRLAGIERARLLAAADRPASSCHDRRAR